LIFREGADTDRTDHAHPTAPTSSLWRSKSPAR
jgi:hypothetical protein